jgi:hypothetical protein
MGTPRIGQLPLAILLVPDLESVVRRPRHNAIAVKIELCDCDQVAMAGLEIGEVGTHV